MSGKKNGHAPWRYKSFIYKGKSPLLVALMDRQDMTGVSPKALHEASGISRGTLRNWRKVNGTRSPKSDTALASAYALGVSKINLRPGGKITLE